MRAIAQETSLDPTKPENAEALTGKNVEGIRNQIKSAVQASYDLTHRKKKKEPAIQEPAASAPEHTQQPEPSPTPEQQPDQDPGQDSSPAPDTKLSLTTTVLIKILEAAENQKDPQILQLIGENPDKEELRGLIATLTERRQQYSATSTALSKALKIIKSTFPGTVPATPSQEPDPSPPPQSATEPPAKAKPEQEPFQSILESLISGKELDKETIANLDREALQELIVKLRHAKERLQSATDATKDVYKEKGPQETHITVEQALANPEQVKDCYTFRNLVANNELLPAEQQIALLKSGIDLAKRKENPAAAIGMLIRLSTVYEKAGRIGEAIDTHEEVFILQVRAGNQRPENVKETLHVIMELNRNRTLKGDRTNHQETSRQPPTEVRFPTPATPGNILRACHDLARAGKFDEGEAMANKAMVYLSMDDRFGMQKIGFQTAKIIIANPSTIKSLQTRQLIAANHTLERAGELELAIKCLEELLTRSISSHSRENCTARVEKIRKELEAQGKPQPRTQPPDGQYPSRTYEPASAPAPASAASSASASHSAPAEPSVSAPAASAEHSASAANPTSTPDTPPRLTIQPPPEKEKKPEEILRENLISWLSRIKKQAGKEKWRIRTERIPKQKGGYGEKHYLVIPEDKKEELLRQFSEFLEMENGKVGKTMGALCIVSSTETGTNGQLEGMVKNLKGQLAMGELATKGRIIDDILRVLGEEV
jgi:hypothetical protein